MMSDELRKVAQTCMEADTMWRSADEMATYLRNGGVTLHAEIDADYIAAASPEVVLGLLDERDQWKQAAEQNMLDYQEAYRDFLDAREVVRRLIGVMTTMQDA
jgi:hypothetical protein